MPLIEILASRLGPAVHVDADGPLVDVCDDARAPIDFSCRSASCGTCRVRVLEGAALLEPPRDDELEVLRLFDSPPDARLACQAKASPGAGVIRLAWIDD
jgi:ferredoxin